MDRKLKIAVIFGGCSPEYPVSLESAHSVIVNLDREKYEPVLLGITRAASGSASSAARKLWRTTAGTATARSASPPLFPRTGTCTAWLNSA